MILFLYAIIFKRSAVRSLLFLEYVQHNAPYTNKSYATKIVRTQMNSYHSSFASITIAHVMILNGNFWTKCKCEVRCTIRLQCIVPANGWIQINAFKKQVYSSNFNYVSSVQAENTAIFIEFTMPCMFMISKTLQTYFGIESKSNHRLYEPVHIAMWINQWNWNATAQQNTKSFSNIW